MLSIRLATKGDFDFFYELKSEDFNIFWTGGGTKPEVENLRKFFYTAVEKAGEKDTGRFILQKMKKGKKLVIFTSFPTVMNMICLAQFLVISVEKGMQNKL